MPISDSNPERKNLIITSIAFILFYVAGGRFDGDEIRIIVVNLSFSRPEALVAFSWVLLFWFCLRFYQKSNKKFIYELKREAGRSTVPQSLDVLACNLAKEQLQGANRSDHINKKIKVMATNLFEEVPISVTCNFMENSNGSVHQERVLITGIRGFYYRYQALLTQIFLGNAFAELAVPYLLFILAVSAPFWSMCINYVG